MVKDADGQRLRRRPNVGAVGVGYADSNALGIAIFHFTTLF
jgi:hypothetical protein